MSDLKARLYSSELDHMASKVRTREQRISELEAEVERPKRQVESHRACLMYIARKADKMGVTEWMAEHIEEELAKEFK